MPKVWKMLRMPSLRAVECSWLPRMQLSSLILMRQLL